MDVLNAIETRKSIREYSPKPVEKEKLETVIRAGNLAPIFGKFHITVIQTPELLAEVNTVTLDMMKHSGNEFLEKRAADENYNPLYGAAAMIVLSADGGNDSHGFNMANVSCAAENMILEATELELGTCFVMGAMMSFSNPALAEKIHLPENHVPLVGVLVGYSTHEMTANTREMPDNVTYC